MVCFPWRYTAVWLEIAREKVAGLARNGWQVPAGTGGRFIPESVAGCDRCAHIGPFSLTIVFVPFLFTLDQLKNNISFSSIFLSLSFFVLCQESNYYPNLNKA